MLHVRLDLCWLLGTGVLGCEIFSTDPRLFPKFYSNVSMKMEKKDRSGSARTKKLTPNVEVEINLASDTHES